MNSHPMHSHPRGDLPHMIARFWTIFEDAESRMHRNAFTAAEMAGINSTAAAAYPMNSHPRASRVARSSPFLDVMDYSEDTAVPGVMDRNMFTAAETAGNNSNAAADPINSIHLTTDLVAAARVIARNMFGLAADPIASIDPYPSAYGAATFPPNYVFCKNSIGSVWIKGAVNNNHRFKVNPVGWNGLELYDIIDRRVISMLKPKFRTLHGEWLAFSEETSNVLFTMKRPDIIQPRTNLLVSLADDGGDLKIRGSWKDRSCRVYKNGLVVAEMQSPGAGRPEEDKFMLTIYPDVDDALVVSVFVMLEAQKGSPWKISAAQSSISGRVKTGFKYLGPIGGLVAAVVNSCRS